jgi:arogenate dehydrogenase (NADP+)
MNIGIVGLGLIGGSLGLELRAQGHQVVGVSRKLQTCDRAVAIGAVNRAGLDFRGLADVDLVFLCTPLGAMEATVRQMVPQLAPETVITDVGSVKGSVVETIAPLWPNFVGGHPMAGTADSGIDAAHLGLFTQAAYVLTPIATTLSTAVALVETVIHPLQVRIYRCTPDAHDRAVAWISHLPVMIGAGLITACRDEPDASVLELAMALASSGFRDTSRVGGGNPELGVMMAQYNRTALLQALRAYRSCLDEITTAIEQKDWSTLDDRLRQAQQQRSAFIPLAMTKAN